MDESRLGFNCESCGADISFPGDQKGTVQECPTCFDFVDVPEANARGTDEIPQSIDDDAKAELYVRSADQVLILDMDCGLPHPRWSDFHQSIDDHIATSQFDEVYLEAARLWLNEFARLLPEGYQVSESDEFYLLSHSAKTDAQLTLEFCERSRRTILDFLSGVAADDGFGKHIVLAFTDAQYYYSYVSVFCPDGESGGSAGMFLSDGYGHTACIAGWALHRTIAHEMTHCLLRHLPLPLWLNEGVTQIAEDKLMDDSWFQPEAKDANRIRTYFSENSLDAFWSGAAFSASDEGQELSYMLSRIIVMQLFTDTSENFWHFVRSADWSDAGRGAYEAEIGG